MIYAAYNSFTDKYYVGKTVKSLCKRRWEHEWLASRNSPTAFHRALRKYGFHVFWWVVLSENEKSKSSQNYLEKYFIRAFHARTTQSGYNMTEGGDGGLGMKPSLETLQKRSLAMKGRKFSAEHCLRISLAKKGKNLGRIPWNKGLSMSEETRQKLKNTLQKKYHDS